MLRNLLYLFRNMRLWDGKGYIGMLFLGLLLNKTLIPVRELMAFAAASMLFVGYAFSINNCFDVDTDSVNKRKKSKNPVASGEISRSGAMLFSFILIASGTLIVARFFSRTMLLIYVMMGFLATIYSAPPRLKAIPILDVVSHGFFFGMLPVYFGAYYDGALTAKELWVGVAFFLYSCFLQLRNLLEDYRSDAVAGLRTTPVVVGPTSSIILSVLSGALSNMLAAWIIASSYPILLVFSFLIFVLFVFLGREKLNRILDCTMVMLCILLILD